MIHTRPQDIQPILQTAERTLCIITRLAHQMYDAIGGESGACYEGAMALGILLAKEDIRASLVKGNVDIPRVECNHHYWLEYRPEGILIDCACAQFGYTNPWVKPISCSPQYIDRQPWNNIMFDDVIDFLER